MARGSQQKPVQLPIRPDTRRDGRVDIGDFELTVRIEGDPVPEFEAYLMPKVQRLIERELAQLLREALKRFEREGSAPAAKRARTLPPARSSGTRGRFAAQPARKR